MNLGDLTKEERTYMFGLQRLEDAFKNVDCGNGRILNCEFVNCNKDGFEQVKDYVLNGVHAIWPFKIEKIEDEHIKIIYKDTPIHIYFNIRGAY